MRGVLVILLLFATAASALDVTVYGVEGCKECGTVVEYLTARENVSVVYKDIGLPAVYEEFEYLRAQYNLAQAVPVARIDDTVILGSDNIIRFVENKESRTYTRYSLPVLAITLGFLDGVNPCAMWALVLMLGIVLGLHDKKKLWLLVGTFVIASGAWYFLFMTAWLNAFLLVGYVRVLTVAIGILAVGTAIKQGHSLWKEQCKMPSKTKQKIAGKLKETMAAQISVATVATMIMLALVINAIEFVCSSFLPAIFTQTLALKSLPTWQYYGYILLYDFFFMLNNLIIFGAAAFAISKVPVRYVTWSRIIGGFLLLALGLLLIFAPNILQ